MFYIHVLILLTQTLAAESISTKIICIKESTDNHSSDCSKCGRYGTLTSNLSLLIEDNTELKFCNNQTIILFDLIHIDNKTNVSLHSSNVTVIECQEVRNAHGNGAGFRFTNIIQLQITNITFLGCGAIHGGSTILRSSKTMPFLASIYIYYSTNVSIKQVRIENGNGTGLAIIDTTGYVEVAFSLFKNNSIKGKSSLSGGRGMYVDFTYCPPGIVTVTGCENKNRNNKNSIYVFTHNTFEANTASHVINWHHTPLLHRSQIKLFQDVGFGGGLTIYIGADASGNNITIRNCNFLVNKAILGGGLLVSLHDEPSNNLVDVRNCAFDKNVAERGGGGIDVGFLIFGDHPTSPTASRNFVMVSHCNVTGNVAKYGGGTKVFSTKSLYKRLNNSILFDKCRWEQNRARFGSAVEISPHVWDIIAIGYLPHLKFKDCNFSSNFRLEVKIEEKFSANYTWGKGTILTSSFPIFFSGKILFQFSNSSALYASSSCIEFDSGSVVEFKNNTGYEGAAVALIGFSALLVQDNSIFRFFYNNAISRGGAISYRSSNKLDFASSRSCFIQYVGATIESVEDRNITFQFQHNKVGINKEAYGQTIYATTILPCVRGCSGREGKKSIHGLNCIGTFKFINEKRHEISTSGARFVIQRSYIQQPIGVIPGQEIEFEFQILDDLNNETFDSYHVLLEKTGKSQGRVRLDPTYRYITDKTVRLYGDPGERAHILLGTTGFREITISFEIRMEQCPPGYVTQMNAKQKGSECICSANTPNKTYIGIKHCNQNELRAYMKRGYWFGYDGDVETEESLKSGYCPRGFCFGKQSELFDYVQSSNTSLSQFVCSEYRQSKLCGSCIVNHSHFFHSDNYKCFPNKYCGVGLFWYLVSEIVPVSVLFVIVIFFNIRLTSGAVNGFIFFFQFIDTMLIDANGFIPFHPIVDILTSTYLFSYRMFNLNFFTLDQLSFCLWKGANTLDVLAVKYVTITYSLLLVFATALLMKVCNITRLKRSKFLALGGSVKGTVIHGFSTFFVMCYSQCAKVTLFLLTPSLIYSVGPPNNHNTTRVIFYAGDYLYFHSSHLKYAIPALIILIVLILIPPIFLLVYPFCYKIFALLGIEETRCVQVICKVAPLEKMKPLFDSFQSCYKDKYRFFAGLYFLYRLVALITFLALDSQTKFYIAFEIQLIVMLTLQATTYAYRKRWHNILDTLLFADLAIINALTMLNYKLALSDNFFAINILSGIQVFLVVLPMLYILCFLCSRIVLRLKILRGQTKKEEELTDTLRLIDYREYESSM